MKRKEEVSLLMTVFNYHDNDFCFIAVDHKLGLTGRTKVPGSDAWSVAVPILPKRTEEIEVKVSSILQVKSGHTAQDCWKAPLLYFSEDSVFSEKGRTSFSANDSLQLS